MQPQELARYEIARLTGAYRVVSRGTRSGVVPAAGLSQPGCSWIFADAAVEGAARVVGNAVLAGDTRVKKRAQIRDNAFVIDAVVEGNAQVRDNAVIDDALVSGHAEISGDAAVTGAETVVTGNARVSGDAVISGGARVHGNAQVLGDAKVTGGDVSGNVMVTGKAVVVDGMIVDGSDCRPLGAGEVCVYDGRQELNRAAQQSLNELYNEVKEIFVSCKFGDEAERLAIHLVYPKSDDQGRGDRDAALAILTACETVEALWNFVDIGKLGTGELAIELITGLLGVGWFARLRPFVRGLWGIFEVVYTYQVVDDVLRLKGATTEAIERRQELCSRLGRPRSCTVLELRD